MNSVKFRCFKFSSIQFRQVQFSSVRVIRARTETKKEM